MEAIFSGEKELFKGLCIEDKITWEKRTVLRFSFDLISSRQASASEMLMHQIREIAHKNGIVLQNDGIIKPMLSELVQKTAANKPIVVLVDEYDKPILDAIPNEMARAEDGRLVLKEFFETIKTEDAHIHLLFVTGVSKFSSEKKGIVDYEPKRKRDNGK